MAALFFGSPAGKPPAWTLPELCNQEHHKGVQCSGAEDRMRSGERCLEQAAAAGRCQSPDSSLPPALTVAEEEPAES